MPTKSLYPDLDIPDVDIWTFLFERKDREYPDDKVIYLDLETNRSYTYKQVKETAVDFGKGLKALWEWQKGDVIGLFAPNNVDIPSVIWGAQWAGGVPSPANPGYTAEELSFQLKDSRAKALVTEYSLLGVAKKAAEIAGIPEDRIILLGEQRDKTAKFKHFTSIRNTSGAVRYRRSKATKPRADLAFLVYSSGTTGHPKGVMLSHTNIISNILMLKFGEGGNLTWDGGKDKIGDTMIAFLPFYHIYGLNCILHQSLYTGLRTLVMAKFDLEKFCSNIQNHQVTFCYVVPPVILQLGKSPIVNKYDLSSLRMMNSGAAPLTRELVYSVYDRIKVPIKQGYGLSETSPSTHTQPWERWNTSIGAVGTLLPNQIAKYMSEEGEEVSVGQTGELWIKGPNIFLGYLNNVNGTKNALTDDGYFKTGDVGHQDKDGNFFITDRVKELIKFKGFQVPPAELEGLLISHPDIDDIAVIGIYDEDQATEIPRAYVVPKKGIEGSLQQEKDIVSWLSKKVANHKRLRGGVRFVDEIPKSPSGKILRRVLKVKAQEEHDKGEKASL